MCCAHSELCFILLIFEDLRHLGVYMSHNPAVLIMFFFVLRANFKYREKLLPVKLCEYQSECSSRHTPRINEMEPSNERMIFQKARLSFEFEGRAWAEKYIVLVMCTHYYIL